MGSLLLLSTGAKNEDSKSVRIDSTCRAGLLRPIRSNSFYRLSRAFDYHRGRIQLSKHRARRQKLYWWQRKRLIAYQIQAWKLRIQEEITEVRDMVAEAKERKNNG